MPWADVRLNTEANFETSKEEKEDDRISMPPFGWYRWANDKEANPPIRDDDKLRLPPIRDGRKISYISFIITEEEMEEESVTKKEDETENERKTDKITNEEAKTREEDHEKEDKEEEWKEDKDMKDKEEEWKKEDIFSHSLAPSTFRLALASLPQGIEQTGRESR